MSNTEPQKELPQNNSNSGTRSWCMACHLSSFALFLGIPFTNIFGPMIIWLIKRDSMPEVDVHGKESMNFQLSMTIYYLLAGLACFVFIGFLFLPVLLLLHIIFVIQATVAADKGHVYRYPMTIRFIQE